MRRYNKNIKVFIVKIVKVWSPKKSHDIAWACFRDAVYCAGVVILTASLSETVYVPVTLKPDWSVQLTTISSSPRATLSKFRSAPASNETG